MQRLWRIVSSPGVVWWGIPTALLGTYLQVRRETGWSLAVLASLGFWFKLIVTLLVTGVLGGHAFEWMMRKCGIPLRVPFPGNDHDRTA